MSIIGLFFMVQADAGIPVWTFSTPTPSSAMVFAHTTATVQYTITNQSTKPKLLVLKPIPGLSAAPCQLVTKGSICILNILVTGSHVPAGGIHSGPILCEADARGNPNPNQCYQPSPGNQLNITFSNVSFTIEGTISGLAANGLILQNNGTDNLSIQASATTFQFPTPVTPGGSYNVTILQQPTGQFCSISNGFGSNLMANVNNVVINCRNLFAYISDFSNILWQCPVDIVTGGLSGSCAPLTNSPAFESTTIATFATFSGNTFAYVADQSNTLWQCPINTTTGSFSGSCTALMNVPSFVATINVTFARFSGNTYAYVGNLSNILWQCPVNTTTGGFSGSCTALTNSPAFFETSNAIFSTFSGNTFAYVSDGSNTLWQCPVNTITGGFSGSCMALTNPPIFNTVFGTAFETFSGNTYVYVSDNSSNLWQCPINMTTGGFNGSCIPLAVPAVPFNGTGFTTFATFSGNTYAYIGDRGSSMWQCPIDMTTGGFSSSCTALVNVPPFSAAITTRFN